MKGRRSIEVVADWAGLTGPRRMGSLTAAPARGKEVFAFEYDEDWLASRPAPAIDPALHLFRGAQYPPTGHEQFGVFLDSAPDRWGRLLMRRREALRARREGRPERALVESDYLLGVHDAHRLGGLRFRVGGPPEVVGDVENRRQLVRDPRRVAVGFHRSAFTCARRSGRARFVVQ